MCDILANLKSRPLFTDVKRHSNFQKSPQASALHNFKLFLKEIGSNLPGSMREITAQDLYTVILIQDPNKLLLVLNWLMELFGHENNQNPGITDRAIRDQNTSIERKISSQNSYRKLKNSQFERQSTPKARILTPKMTGKALIIDNNRLINTPRARTPLNHAKNYFYLNSPNKSTRTTPQKTYIPISQEGYSDTQIEAPQRTRREIKEIPEHVKSQIHEWLVSLGILKHDLIEEMTSGVLLCDLINRLEGRCEVIKGIHRFPKNKSAIHANINKALSYLRQLEKMNSDYL